MIESTRICIFCQKVFKPSKETSKYCSRNCFNAAGSGKVINTPEVFWSKVDKNGPNGCWIWKGWINPTGYGKLKFWGKSLLAHRMAWELTYGPIPDGFICCHHCDNPACVNIEKHIFLGTHMDNTRDRQSKGRTNVYPGERAPNAKLTFEQVSEIRNLYASGFHSCLSLSKQFSVGKSQIKMIVKNKNWHDDNYVVWVRQPGKRCLSQP